MCLISVIVPIYKVENFLKRCVDSILHQSFEDFELILVDDGSPDRCGIICDEYAHLDVRIKVIHKENGGLSDARNAGLAIASGEYVAFVDSDDWVASTYLEELFLGIKTANADICECNIIRTTETDIKPTVTKLRINTYSTVESIKLLIEDRIFHQYVWNKLYRRSVIDDIVFPKGKTNEDEFWTYQVFGNAKKITHINSELYFYFQRNESIMGSGYSIKRLDAIEAKVERQNYLDINYPTLSGKGKINLFFSCIYAGQMSLIHLSENESDKAFQIFRNIMKQYSIYPLVVDIEDVKDKAWFLLGVLNFKMTCWIRNILKIGF